MKQYWKAPELLDRKEPAELGLVYTSVRRLEVGPEPVTVESGDEEMCFFCIAGSAAYTCGAHTGEAVLLDQLYLPAHASMTLTSARGGVLMQYGAPCARPRARRFPAGPTPPFYQCRSAPQCARHTHPAPWG